MRFAISTAAFRGQSVEEMIQSARNEGFSLEFSSGLPYQKDLENIFLTANIIRLPHNYFPAPVDPFVLNLASLDEKILSRSIEHCMKGLRLAAAVSAPFYSVHAGFSIDPKTSDLGKRFTRESSIKLNHDLVWSTFINSTKLLCQEAEKLKVDLLIENNVTTMQNLDLSGSSLLLCSDEKEIHRLFSEIDSTFLGLLVDTGHVKVSAQTLGFSKETFLMNCSKYIKAFHHSDNDGVTDQNYSLTSKYWFLELASHFKNSFHILEVLDLTISEVHAQLKILSAALAG